MSDHDLLRKVAKWDSGQGEFAVVPCDLLGALLVDFDRHKAALDAIVGSFNEHDLLHSAQARFAHTVAHEALHPTRPCGCPAE